MLHGTYFLCVIFLEIPFHLKTLGARASAYRLPLDKAAHKYFFVSLANTDVTGYDMLLQLLF